MKTPTIVKLDAVFLAKKYMLDLPSHLHYIKLLEDFDILAKTSTTGSQANFKLICLTLRKALIAFESLSDVTLYFKKHCKQYPRDFLLTPLEFVKACKDLHLVPEFCTEQALNALYAEIDTANTKKVTMDQVSSYI
jgi:hypothetical protein